MQNFAHIFFFENFRFLLRKNANFSVKPKFFSKLVSILLES